MFASEPQEIPFRAKLPKNNGKGDKVVNELFKVNNYDDSYLGSASIATATTYSDNSVYSQLGTQVGPQNVAATARAMGVETDLSTKTQYSIADGPFEPYNPALILGGLEVGVTPAGDGARLQHARRGRPADLGLDGLERRRPARDPRRLRRRRLHRRGGTDCYQQGDPVPDGTGASGVNKVIAKPVIDAGVAEETRSILSTVVSEGTGHLAQTSDPTWGKTGTTDDNGDAWFCGATPKVTACVWVGFPDTVTPMETEFGGAPVDGGTFPALIFSRVIDAYDAILASRNEGEDVEASTDEIDSAAGGAPATATEPTDTSGASSRPSPRPRARRLRRPRRARPRRHRPRTPAATPARPTPRPRRRRRAARAASRRARRPPAPRPQPAAAGGRGSRCRRRRSATAARWPW